MLLSAPRHPSPTLGVSNGEISPGRSSPCAAPASAHLDALGSGEWGKNIHLGFGDNVSVQGYLWPCRGAW